MVEFILFSLLVTVVPVVLVFVLNDKVEKLELSETAKTMLKVLPAILVINIAIGVYIIKAIKDPDNYVVFKKNKKENWWLSISDPLQLVSSL